LARSRCLAAATPTSASWSCRHLFAQARASEPGPPLPASHSPGTTTPPLTVIRLSWASPALGGFGPLPPRALPCGGELPGASSSWRAGAGASPSEREERASERARRRELVRQRRPTRRSRAPAEVGAGAGAGAGAGSAVWRLRAWGAGPALRRTPLPLPAQRTRLGRHPDRPDDRQTAAGGCARPRTQSSGLEGPRAREEGCVRQKPSASAAS
jgi:hypothetical protein